MIAMPSSNSIVLAFLKFVFFWDEHVCSSQNVLSSLFSKNHSLLSIEVLSEYKKKPATTSLK